jgi:DNA (cytosine-5)-methyltransferase 1
MLIRAADLFCGAGGTSSGLVHAAKALDLQLDLVAVNHWQTAVDTHTLNHPWARHLCADLGALDPSKVIPGGRLDLLVASPECTHFSVARGGKPCSDQSRASAWHVCHWAERLRIEHILIENVKEFATWGPLLPTGRPDPAHRGDTFRAFVAALESMGYHVEHRILNAADFGDATTRRRLFLQADLTSKPKWPNPSHAGRWRPARDVIDWQLPSQSIFTRKRPLCKRTLDRIEVGLRKFGGSPFIAVLRGTHESQAGAWAKPLSDPLGTISAGGIHAGICEPFVVNVAHDGADNSRTRSVDAPLPCIPAGHRGELAVCQPFLTKYYGTGRARHVDQPLDTITSKDRFALVEPTRMDIRFRMLQPHELAAAMGFDAYQFAGTKTDQVRQIGNAVSVRTSTALCTSILKSLFPLCARPAFVF